MPRSRQAPPRGLPGPRSSERNFSGRNFTIPEINTDYLQELRELPMRKCILLAVSALAFGCGNSSFQNFLQNPPFFPVGTTRVSVDSSGVEGNGLSVETAFSADARFVAFVSAANNLVANDTNNQEDIFVHDRQTGVTTRVSLDSNGAQANSVSDSPYLSGDGRFVAFDSNASNLVANDNNGSRDVFVHDRQTGITTRVSLDSSGVEGNDESFDPIISPDGRFVAFTSDASNLVANDTNGVGDVFVHDRETGTTTRVSVDSGGVEGNFVSAFPSMSADGRLIAFRSLADNLVANDTNGAFDIFVHDRQTGTTTRVSVDSAGVEADSDSEEANFSADGRFVAFESDATNLVANDTNNDEDVFVRDLQTNTTTRVSLNAGGAQANGPSFRPWLSADGRFVAFESQGSDLVANDTNGNIDVFVRDLQNGTNFRASVDSNGAEANSFSGQPVLSADGLAVVFVSAASNLVPNDTNGVFDIFVNQR